jgi:hypothetical protein
MRNPKPKPPIIAHHDLTQPIASMVGAQAVSSASRNIHEQEVIRVG